MKRYPLTILYTSILASLICCNTPIPPARNASIIPEPVTINTTQGAYTLQPGASIAVADTSLLNVAKYYAQSIEKATGLKLKVTDKPTGDIILSATLTNDNPEAYSLISSKEGVKINGATVRGVIMSAATLQQLLPPVADDGANIPFVEINDYPRFSYRGIHLDVSRHFYTVSQVKDLLDLMARYKLNKFHWHLTDDQGWRIEIKQYPMLTDSGAYRKFNSQDRQCQAYQQSLDDPTFTIPDQLLRISGTDTLYGGYYTQNEIRDVVAYAAARAIDILPEIDMPGHLMAAIIGYPFLSCNGKAKWGASFSDPLCVGNDQALQMVKDIYTEVAALFPYEYMHLGADEVEKTNWKSCPRCQQRMKINNLKTEEELQAWFVHDMEAHFNSLGKKLIGWDEIIEGGLSPTATIMWWRDWAPQAVPQATAQGNKAIMSPCFSMYFDAWESENTLQNTYKFEPVLPTLNAQQAKNIIGVQGNLWCETVPSVERMQNMYFPRILALAETAWSQPTAKNWEKFFAKFTSEVEYLDAHDINYRIPNLKGFGDINVFTDTATVQVYCPLPNIQIRYTTDGSNPTVISPLYTEPLKITESTDYTFRGFRPNGTSGEMFKASYRKETFAPADTAFVQKTKGLEVKIYDYKGVYNKKQCSRVDSAKLLRTYMVDSLNMTSEIKGFMGLVATGYIDIPENGIYTFALKSNDGSTLAINGVMLIDNDSTHGDVEMTAQKALAKGWHKVEIRFFDLNNGGCLRLMMNGKVIANYAN